jgi:hypothetical protein
MAITVYNKIMQNLLYYVPDSHELMVLMNDEYFNNSIGTIGYQQMIAKVCNELLESFATPNRIETFGMTCARTVLEIHNHHADINLSNEQFNYYMDELTYFVCTRRTIAE